MIRCFFFTGNECPRGTPGLRRFPPTAPLPPAAVATQTLARAIRSGFPPSGRLRFHTRAGGPDSPKSRHAVVAPVPLRHPSRQGHPLVPTACRVTSRAARVTYPGAPSAAGMRRSGTMDPRSLQVLHGGPTGTPSGRPACGQAVCSVSPYRFNISLTGWCQVSPPPLQLPQPPEVTPCAWSPLMKDPPESPGSAQTLVFVIW